MQRASLILILCLSSVFAAGAQNLLQNGAFQQGLAGWQFLVNNGAAATGELDPFVKHGGYPAFKITNKSGEAANVFGRLTQIVTGLQPWTTYKVTCWARGKGCGVCWIGGGPGWNNRHSFPKGDFDWTNLSFTVGTDANADNYDLMVLTESQTEDLWVTGIRFDSVSVDKARQDAVYAGLNAKIDACRARLDGLSETNNPYIRLGLAVARRFLGFAGYHGPGPQMTLAWKNLQMEEVADVLDETDKIALQNSPLLNWTPPRIGRVKLKNGVFRNDGRPYYFYGYGHFDSVIDDLSNFPALGASLIQDGRAGPSSMAQDGTLSEGALNVVRGLDRAAKYGMRTDVLLSPHYFPGWAMAPGVLNGNIGFINFNIFHPKAKDAIGRWIAAIAEKIKDKPALHSVCLANEPVYNCSGRDPYSRPAFSEFLRQKHHTIDKLNQLYGTSYKNFDEVAVPACAMPAKEGAQRAYYDWTCFNKKMFADWHAWMDSVLKAHGVKAPTHTKIMVFQTMDRDKVGWGVDPELICHATDLAGCDAYAFPGGAYAYDWIGHEFFYDLLHSFRGQPVFNSENHFIPDGSPPVHFPMNHSRAVIWQDGLHHEGSTTIWVWEMATGQGLDGSIYFRPANIFGADRAMLDLNRLSPEVTAINNAKPRVALLWSQPSIFWQEGYKGAMFSIYTALNFLGEPITFVSERELAAGAASKVDWIIAPRTTHILDTTRPALEKFRNAGGHVLLIGADCLGRDEYNRPLKGAVDYPSMNLAGTDEATASFLRQALQPMDFAQLLQSGTRGPVWGVEFRVVKSGKSVLVPMIDLGNARQTVFLPEWEGHPAVDLLSGEDVNPGEVELDSMLPRLLKID